MSNERSPRGLCSTTIGTSGMVLSFRQLGGCQITIATRWLSKEAAMAARREIEIEATPEEVWEALATEEGRDALARGRPGARDPRRGRRGAVAAGLVVVARRRAADARRVPRRRGARRARAWWSSRARRRSRWPRWRARSRRSCRRERRDRARLRRARRPDAPPDRRDAAARGLDERAGAHRRAADHPPGGRQAPRRARRRGPGRARARRRGREVRYRLRPGALAPAASWLRRGRGGVGRAGSGASSGAVEGRGSG